MTWILVAHDTKGGDGNTIASSNAIDTTGANLIVVEVGNYLVPITTGTLVDSKGNSWTPLTEYHGSLRSRLFYCINPIVGPGHTFTYTATSGPSYPSIGVVAFTAPGTISVGSESGLGLDGTQTSQQPGSLTPSADDALLVTGIVTGGVSHSIDSGFTAYSIDFANTPTAHDGLGIAWLNQSTAAAVNPTWSWSSTIVGAATGMVYFTASGSTTTSTTTTSTTSTTSTTTTTPGTTTIHVDDANLFYLPEGWRRSGSVFLETNAPGNYFKVKLSGSSLMTLLLDTTPNSGESSGNYPSVAWSIDNGPLQVSQLTNGQTTLNLGTGTALDLYLKGSWCLDNRYTDPIQSVLRVTGLQVNNGITTVAPSLLPGRILVYWDSNGEGYQAGGNTVSVTDQDATLASPCLIARGLNCEFAVRSFASQGYLATGSGNIPALPSNWDHYDSAHSLLSGSLFPTVFDYILSLHGQNDGGPVQSVVTSQISAWRAAAGSQTKIVIITPTTLAHASELLAAVTASGDPKAYYVTLGEALYDGNGRYTVSNHLTGLRGHPRHAAIVVGEIRRLTGSSLRPRANFQTGV